MTSPIPHVLVLDFGGVISRTMFETHRLTESALGLEAGSLTWMGPFSNGEDSAWVDMQAGKMSERDYWMLRTREVGAIVGKPWTKMEDFVRAARGAEPNAIIRPEFHAALRVAIAADKELAVLSNELDLFYGADFRDKLPFLQQFDVIVDGTYTGILKPDPRAYQSVCDDLCVPASACVFVDDQRRNIDGAIAAGMVPVHFDVTNPKQSYADALSLLGLAYSEDAAA
jgi:putative hydrolase of the HAD superfamily